MTPYLTPDEVADVLGVSRGMVLALGRSGALERIVIGHRTVRFTRAGLA